MVTGTVYPREVHLVPVFFIFPSQSSAGCKPPIERRVDCLPSRMSCAGVQFVNGVSSVRCGDDGEADCFLHRKNPWLTSELVRLGIFKHKPRNEKPSLMATDIRWYRIGGSRFFCCRHDLASLRSGDISTICLATSKTMDACWSAAAPYTSAEIRPSA